MCVAVLFSLISKMSHSTKEHRIDGPDREGSEETKLDRLLFYWPFIVKKQWGRGVDSK